LGSEIIGRTTNLLFCWFFPCLGSRICGWRKCRLDECETTIRRTFFIDFDTFRCRDCLERLGPVSPSVCTPRLIVRRALMGRPRYSGRGSIAKQQPKKKKTVSYLVRHITDDSNGDSNEHCTDPGHQNSPGCPPSPRRSRADGKNVGDGDTIGIWRYWQWRKQYGRWVPRKEDGSRRMGGCGCCAAASRSELRIRRTS